MPDPQHLLTILFLVPLIGTLAIACSPEGVARKMAIGFSAAMCAVSGWVMLQFNIEQAGTFQFVERAPWFNQPFPIQYAVGVDGMSLALVVLTAFVTLMAVLASTSIGDNRPRLYYAMLMLLVFSVQGVFLSLDLLQFFVMYELELVPMYFLIAIWGGPRRNYAALKFLIYTFFGGVLMLGGLLYMYTQMGGSDPSSLSSFDMTLLAERCPGLPKDVQILACLGFFLAFIIKLPSFPVHTWLPDAHVEAPTPISMLLAGLLLKMGSYGLVRICLAFFPYFFIDYGPQIMALGAFNIVWAAMACLVQQDMKRVIALSSVSHMGFVLLGIASLSSAAINGAIFQMISHGVISALLFFLVGCVYERTHTRNITEIGGGLAKQMPHLFYFWMLGTMANLGLPGLSGFVAEAAVFYGSYTSPMAMSAAHGHLVQAWIWFAATGVVLTAAYMLWLLKRLFYGAQLPKWDHHLSDATLVEKGVAYALCFSVLALGIYPLMLTKYYGPIADKLSDDIRSRMTAEAPQDFSRPYSDAGSAAARNKLSASKAALFQ
ncbi:MAG: NuoM family protein [Cyanobacteria bacterium SZAS LIN-3]|nr:NuoM family protein [Cyanobacteria bacterium SZAS LIN-3]